MDRSPYLKKLAVKCTPTRLQELIDIAVCPTEPVKGICCGSSCDPCNLVLYKQELRIWKECHENKETAAADELEW
jgi:hypothetical protein